MPTPALKAMAQRYGVALATAERYWAEARRQYGDDYEAVMGTVKKRLASKRGGMGRALMADDP
jgi:hypothetical protein